MNLVRIAFFPRFFIFSKNFNFKISKNFNFKISKNFNFKISKNFNFEEFQNGNTEGELRRVKCKFEIFTQPDKADEVRVSNKGYRLDRQT